jgi:adenylate cyclase
MAEDMTQSRRLAAILAADVVGYSRLMEMDEAGTLNRLRSTRTDVIDPKISEHRGRLVKTTGDGLLVEFTSVVDALRCATEIQNAVAASNAGIGVEDRIEFRIGINVGDIVVEDGDIFGDGVNVAARLEGLAEPGGICVSARVQEDVAGRLDLTFDDIGEQSLKNIARPVRVYRVRLATAETAPIASMVETTAVLALPDKPSIAVLPFANLSGDPEQEYFADGMVEEIITALSRIRWLFVIARNSSFTYKGRAVDVKQVARELGVRYVLEGSVRKAGHRVRITGQLIDTSTGAHIWADRFDGSLEDVFELQDRVAVSVAGVIEPALQRAEARRTADRRTADLTAYDLYLRALAIYFPITKQRVLEALGHLEQAISIDRQFGPALAWAAICSLRLVNDGWVAEHEKVRCRAIELAREALQVGENDPRVLVNAAFVLARFGENIGAMLGLVDRALALNPSFARGWYLSGLLRLFAGQFDLTIEHVETSLRLSPRESVGTPLWLVGEAYFFKRQFEMAEPKLLLSIQDHPGSPPAYRTLAACYAHTGRLDEARAIVAKLRALTPLVVYRDLPFSNPEDSEFFLSGLRLAAGEER